MTCKNSVVLICVRPCFQRKGLGHSLLSEAEERMRSEGYTRSVLGRGRRDLFFGAVMDTLSHRFFEKEGYSAENGCLSMFLDLDGYDIKKMKEKYRCSEDLKIMYCPEVFRDVFTEAVRSVEPKWTEHYSDLSSAVAAFADGEPAGFMRLNTDAETIATADGYRTGMPEYIGVTEKYRGRNIGTALMLWGIEQMMSAGCTDVYIDYTSEDTWYSRIGFEDYLWYWMGEKDL